MKSKGYLLFHLNLAFSSIEEEAREEVISKCYHPLLDLIERTNIPMGIEITGWTLEQIKKIDKNWIQRFRGLLESNMCELVGSGYCQIIGPLVPYKLNEWNQKIGINSYSSILNTKPNIVLVNEMAFSQSMVDLYSKFQYKGLVMDKDNIKLALQSDKLPTFAEGVDQCMMPILYSDSILFQKVQHFAHGDISMNDYLTYLTNRINNGELIIPIYTNDAEVFDYRPGRFSEEKPTHHEGEWIRIEKLLRAINSTKKIEFVLPSKALEIYINKNKKVLSKIVQASYPLPVKKQAKYNIARWAVTGKNDLWINTMCHKIYNHLIKLESNAIHDWKQLCEFWASDIRTHITKKRWKKIETNLNKYMYENEIKNKDIIDIDSKLLKPYEVAAKSYKALTLSTHNEEILLNIRNKNIDLDLNLRRGLAIQKLSFASHNMIPCIGTLMHGNFESIHLGADYYSANTIIELPKDRKKITDLERVIPSFKINDDKNLEIHAKINTSLGTIYKIFSISTCAERVSITYDFSDFEKLYGSVRLGIVTLLNNFIEPNTKLFFSNGGKFNEAFNFDGEFNHERPASNLVSSSRGIGATTGQIIINNNKNIINLSWDPSMAAVLPMLSRNKINDKVLSRIIFSMREFDDTLKEPSTLINNFTLNITS